VMLGRPLSTRRCSRGQAAKSVSTPRSVTAAQDSRSRICVWLLMLLDCVLDQINGNWQYICKYKRTDLPATPGPAFWQSGRRSRPWAPPHCCCCYCYCRPPLPSSARGGAGRMRRARIGRRRPRRWWCWCWGSRARLYVLCCVLRCVGLAVYSPQNLI
jgi:hypothetical protein